MNCKWCGVELRKTEDTESPYGVEDIEGDWYCEARQEDCPACEEGEAHPHEVAE